jgi:hypothetical protein
MIPGGVNHSEVFPTTFGVIVSPLSLGKSEYLLVQVSNSTSVEFHVDPEK